MEEKEASAFEKAEGLIAGYILSHNLALGRVSHCNKD